MAASREDARNELGLQIEAKAVLDVLVKLSEGPMNRISKNSL